MPDSAPLRYPGTREVDEIADPVLRNLRVTWTDHLMRLDLPGETLDLGDDVTGAYPASVATPDNLELVALLGRVDPTPASLRESGATDRADFDERIQFIADLFRSRHETSSLLDAPFTPGQVAGILDGRVPEGAL